MKLNIKVRMRNKVFWLAFVPAILLLAEQVAGVFGVTIDLATAEEQFLGIIETVFLLLGILGIVVDPTTEGIGDSERAQGYEYPNTDYCSKIGFTVDEEDE